MKKILLAFDGTHFSEGAFQFAGKLNKLQPILLAGVFMPQTDLADLWSYAPSKSGSIPLIKDEEAVQVQQNIERFKSLCKTSNIEGIVQKIKFAKLSLHHMVMILLFMQGKKILIALYKRQLKN